MQENYRMNEGKNAGYYFQFTDRRTDQILLEGVATGGNKQDCKNEAWNKFGWNRFGDENIKLYMKKQECESENALKSMRMSKGFSQKQLAEYAQVNIRQIQHYEQGTHDINMAAALTVLKLAKALGCDIEDIMNI